MTHLTSHLFTQTTMTGPVLPDERNSHRTEGPLPTIPDPLSYTGTAVPTTNTTTASEPRATITGVVGSTPVSPVQNRTLVYVKENSTTKGDTNYTIAVDPKTPKNESESDFNFNTVLTTPASAEDLLSKQSTETVLPKGPLSPFGQGNEQLNRPEGEGDTRREENDNGKEEEGGENIGSQEEGEEETDNTDYPDFSPSNRNRISQNQQGGDGKEDNSSDRQTESLQRILNLLRSGKLSEDQRRRVMQKLLQVQGPDYGGD